VTEEETALCHERPDSMKKWCETALQHMAEASLQNASL
jgi:hypothetical protein